MSSGLTRFLLLQRKRQAWEQHQITTHLPAKDVRVYDADFAKRAPHLGAHAALHPALSTVWPNSWVQLLGRHASPGSGA